MKVMLSLSIEVEDLSRENLEAQSRKIFVTMESTWSALSSCVGKLPHAFKMCLPQLGHVIARSSLVTAYFSIEVFSSRNNVCC